jgi:hypothetical protein
VLSVSSPPVPMHVCQLLKRLGLEATLDQVRTPVLSYVNEDVARRCSVDASCLCNPKRTALSEYAINTPFSKL